MGAAKTDDLFPDLHNPEGTRIINERCIIRTQDEHRVVLVAGIALVQYALTDRMAEVYAMVNLVEQGWATQQTDWRVPQSSQLPRIHEMSRRQFFFTQLQVFGQIGPKTVMDGNVQRTPLRLDHSAKELGYHLAGHCWNHFIRPAGL